MAETTHQNQQGENLGAQKRRGRGFAGMDPERQREIARAGGRAAHEKGTAHEFTSEEAAEAGRKGGLSRGRARSHPQEEPSTGGSSRK